MIEGTFSGGVCVCSIIIVVLCVVCVRARIRHDVCVRSQQQPAAAAHPAISTDISLCTSLLDRALAAVLTFLVNDIFCGRFNLSKKLQR